MGDWESKRGWRSCRGSGGYRGWRGGPGQWRKRYVADRLPPWRVECLCELVLQAMEGAGPGKVGEMGGAGRGIGDARARGTALGRVPRGVGRVRLRAQPCRRGGTGTLRSCWRSGEAIGSRQTSGQRLETSAGGKYG